MDRLSVCAGLLTLLASVSSLHAWQNPPIKVDCNFNFRVNVRYDPNPMCAPQAPWWSYFPYDPNQNQGNGSGNTYPNWPQTFPPKDEPAKQTGRFPSWPSKGTFNMPEPLATAPARCTTNSDFQLTSAFRAPTQPVPAMPVSARYPVYPSPAFGFGR